MKEFPPGSIPPSFSPGTIMEETVKDIREAKKRAAEGQKGREFLERLELVAPDRSWKPRERGQTRSLSDTNVRWVVGQFEIVGRLSTASET
jgi:hypothetical protein